MKGAKEFTLNRKMYDKVKKMDHGRMQEWARSVHKAGYEEGVKKAHSLDVEKLKESLLEIKGLGVKRVDSILEAVVNCVGNVKGD